jgi:transposase
VLRRGVLPALHSVCDTAPEAIRQQLRRLSTRRQVAIAARSRPGDLLTPTGAAKRSLASIARRWLALDAEITELGRATKTILDTIAAPLLARPGLGYETVGALLCTAGDNPERLATEASFASLCGTAPVPISTGNSKRRRLNRAGDRRGNAALWTVVMVRIPSGHPPTVTYLERRVAEGHSKRDAIRCLKRYIAREIYADIQAITATHPTTGRLPSAA